MRLRDCCRCWESLRSILLLRGPSGSPSSSPTAPAAPTEPPTSSSSNEAAYQDLGLGFLVTVTKRRPPSDWAMSTARARAARSRLIFVHGAPITARTWQVPELQHQSAGRWLSPAWRSGVPHYDFARRVCAAGRRDNARAASCSRRRLFQFVHDQRKGGHDLLYRAAHDALPDVWIPGHNVFRGSHLDRGARVLPDAVDRGAASTNQAARLVPRYQYYSFYRTRESLSRCVEGIPALALSARCCKTI